MDDPRLLPYRQVLPAGSRLFRVRSKRDPGQPLMLFGSPGKALLMGILVEARVSPITVRDMDIETFKRTFIGALTRSYRFPLQSDFVISEYTLKENLPYLTADNLNDDFFDGVSALDPNTAMYYVRHYGTPFLQEDFLAFSDAHRTEPGQPAAADLWLDEISRVRAAFQAQGVVQDAPLFPAQTFRLFQDGDRLNHTFDHYVNWDMVWMFFINLHATVGRPAFGDLDAYFDKMINVRQFSDLVFLGGSTPGYGDCNDNLLGFINNASSCFMDSTLMCMFAFKNSPFFEAMIVQPFRGGAERVCNGNDAADYRIRVQIKEQLLIDVGQLMRGARFVCSNLRRLLGAVCRMNDWTANLAHGPHDPQQMYLRLCNALAYNPIHYVERSIRASNPQGANRTVIADNIHTALLPSVRIEDPGLHIIAWPATWESDFDDIGSGDDRPWRKTEIEIERADCIVVHIDRSISGNPVFRAQPSAPTQAQPGAQFSGIPISVGQNPLGENPAQPPSVLPPPPSVLPPATAGDPLAQLLASFRAQSIANPAATGTSVMMGASNPYYRDELRVNPRRLDVERVMQVNNHPYTLRAVVYSPNDGHYAALLKCGENWFNYDDVNTQYVVARSRVPEAEAGRLIETRGVLLFYYPPFPEVSRAQADQIAAIVAGLPAIGAPNPN